MTDLSIQFLQFIHTYRKDRPVKSAVLEQTFHLRGHEVRDLVRILRRGGYWIGSTAGSAGGYWMTTDKEEYAESMKHLEHRIQSLSVTLKEMRRAIRRVRTSEEQFQLWQGIGA